MLGQGPSDLSHRNHAETPTVNNPIVLRFVPVIHMSRVTIPTHDEAFEPGRSTLAILPVIDAEEVATDVTAFPDGCRFVQPLPVGSFVVSPSTLGLEGLKLLVADSGGTCVLGFAPPE